MIEGFKIDMTAEEILGHLEAQIQRHRDSAARCDARRLRLEGADDSIGPDDDQDDEDDEDPELALCWPGYVEELKRRVDRHRRHEAVLCFFAITSSRMKSIGSVNQICDFSNWGRVATVE